MDLQGPNLFSDLSFCIIDLETTGGDHSYDKIIEIGLVKVENLKIVGELSYLIKPEIPVPEFIQKLTSIHQKDLEHAPKIHEVIGPILEFIGDSILVAHNSSFDVPFLNSELVRMKLPKLLNKTICTNIMTKYLIPEIMNSNLNYMCRIFGIPHKKIHRALEDAKATANLLLIFLTSFVNKGINKINHLYYPKNKYEFDRTHFRKSEDPNPFEGLRLALNSAALISVKGDNGIILAQIPVKDLELEKEALMAHLNDLPWEILTVRICGSFFEALLNVNLHLNKIPVPQQEWLVNYLFDRFQLKRPAESESNAEIIHELPKQHFIVAHHLIPEQFIIFPLLNLVGKHELIFRYPGHKKKLLQFLGHFAKRMELGHAAKSPLRLNLHTRLHSFFTAYLNLMSSQGEGAEVFQFIWPKDISYQQQELLRQLQGFMDKRDTNLNYPAKHL